MSKIKNSGLDQYGAESFEQQQFGTAGVEWVNVYRCFLCQLRVANRAVNALQSVHNTAYRIGSPAVILCKNISRYTLFYFRFDY